MAQPPLSRRGALGRDSRVANAPESASSQVAGFVRAWLAERPHTERELYRRAQERGLSVRRTRHALITLGQNDVVEPTGGGQFRLVPTGPSQPTRRRNR